MLVQHEQEDSGFSPICQNQIQGFFKDFQGPYEGYKYKLSQTGTQDTANSTHTTVCSSVRQNWHFLAYNFLMLNQCVKTIVKVKAIHVCISQAIIKCYNSTLPLYEFQSDCRRFIIMQIEDVVCTKQHRHSCQLTVDAVLYDYSIDRQYEPTASQSCVTWNCTHFQKNCRHNVMLLGDSVVQLVRCQTTWSESHRFESRRGCHWVTTSGKSVWWVTLCELIWQVKPRSGIVNYDYC